MKPFIIPIFISRLGCPHRCIFCNQETATGVSKNEITPSAVRGVVEEFLKYKKNASKDVQIAFYGGSFTALSLSLQTKFLESAQEFIRKRQANSIRISTRPDYINSAILDNLQAHHVRIVEVGAQSMDDEVLLLSQRGHTAHDTIRAMDLLRERGFSVGIHMMLGLPGDNKRKAISTAHKIIQLRPDFVRIHPTLVIKDTPLADLYNRGLYIPMALEEAVELCKEIVILFEQNHIFVIRMGLQPSPSLEHNGNIIAGPYHPAFGQLVRSSIMFDKAKKEIHKYPSYKRIGLQVSPYDLSTLKGQRSSNLRQFIETFNLEKLEIILDSHIERGAVAVVRLD